MAALAAEAARADEGLDRPHQLPSRARHAAGDRRACAPRARGAGHRARLRADAGAVRALRDRAHGDRAPPRRRRSRPRRAGSCERSVALARWAQRPRASTSRSATAPTTSPSRRRCCGSRRATMFDYEWATVQHNVNCRLARAVVVPDAIPPERLRRYGARRQDPRLRGPQGGVLPGRLRARPGCARRSSGSTPRSRSRVVRTPPEVSLYHRFENDLFAQVLDTAAQGAQTVVLAAHARAARASSRGPAASSSPSTRSTRSR